MWNVIAAANSKPVDTKPSGRAGMSQYSDCQTQLHQSNRLATEGSCVTGHAATEPVKTPKARAGLSGGAPSRPVCSRPRRKLGQAGPGRLKMARLLGCSAGLKSECFGGWKRAIDEELTSGAMPWKRL